MKKQYLIVIVALIMIIPYAITQQQSTHAQTDPSLSCAAITNAAVDRARQVCTDLDRGFACYGNDLVEVLPQANQPDVVFESPGDMSAIDRIYSLQLSGLQSGQDRWGIVQMELLASIPQASSEAVSMLLFGSVRVENAGASEKPILVTVDNEFGIALRIQPSFASEVLKKANIRARLWAYERSLDGQWLHVEIPATGELVWISMSDVVSDPNLEALPFSNGETYYRPMQAVYLQSTGSSSPECNDFPLDGMLIQTPEGVGKVTLAVNEVIIELGSTALIEMTASNLMTISLLEGHSFVTSKGVRQELPAGFSTSVLLDRNLKPTSIPSAIIAIKPALLNILTIGPGAVWMEQQYVQSNQAEPEEFARPVVNRGDGNVEPEPEKVTKKKKTAKKTTIKEPK